MARYVNEAKTAEALGLPLQPSVTGFGSAGCPVQCPIWAFTTTKAPDAACDRVAGMGLSQNALDAWRKCKEQRDDTR